VRVNDGVFVTALQNRDHHKQYSPGWLNSLSDEDKQPVAAGPFGRQMQDSGAEHVTWLFWRGERRILGAPLIVHNASAFVLDCGHGPFVVTAGHVFSDFMRDKQNARRVASQIGNLPFDFQDRLIDCGIDDRIDIATFRIDPDEVAKLGKRVVIGTDGLWPSPPSCGEAVYLGGFLGTERVPLSPQEVSFGLPAPSHP